MVKGVSFESLGLEPWLYRAIKAKGYTLPTPIQRKSIPIAFAGNDIIAVAKTGSGKTAAFLIPLLHKLKEHSSTVGARAVIISPTRELAIQTLRFLTELGKYSNLKYALLVGSDGLKQEFTKLAENPDVIVATPGRLMHFIVELKYSLSRVEVVVLDEADRLVEMGLMEQVKVILGSMTFPSRQNLCFSATLPDSLTDFSKTGLSQPVLVKLDQEYRLPETLKIDFWMIRNEDKEAVLCYALKSFPQKQSGIVFVSSRHHVEYLEQLLNLLGFSVIGMFGAMDEEARRKALLLFTKKKKKILITTDVTARGIDIPFLDFVVHFDFPATPKLYIHRSGRAARAGRTGNCLALVTHSEIPYLIDTLLQIGGNDEKSLGSVPEDLISSEKEEIKMRMMNKDTSDLDRRLLSVKNAIKKYNKTRPGASMESVRRAKDFKFNLHPDFTGKSAEFEEFTQKMKEFRPSYNILELNAKLAGKDEAAEIMKLKRLQLKKTKVVETVAEDQETINQLEKIAKNMFITPTNPIKPKRGQQSSYRAEGFLDYDSKNSFEKGKEISQLSLELPMDDELGLRKRDKNVWDNKKKKYIQEQKSKPKLDINQKSQKLYKEWKKDTKKRIQNVGESEDPEIVKKLERRPKEKFKKDPREGLDKIRKEKYQQRLKHKKSKKFDLKARLDHKIAKSSARGKGKIIIRN